jgi:hypothetical protein
MINLSGTSAKTAVKEERGKVIKYCLVSRQYRGRREAIKKTGEYTGNPQSAISTQQLV